MELQEATTQIKSLTGKQNVIVAHVFDIPGYFVTSDGEVYCPERFNKNKLRKKYEKSSGHIQLYSKCRGKDVLVSKLVARAFLPPPPSGADFVEHVDGNNKNHAANNLRWITPTRRAQLASKHQRKQFSEFVELTPEQEAEIRAQSAPSVEIRKTEWPGYFVTSDGHLYSIKCHKVRRVHEKVAKKNGIHVAVCVCGTMRYVRLAKIVACAFIGPKPFQNAVIRHINDEQRDNRVENLQYGTDKENSDDAFRNGRIVHDIDGRFSRGPALYVA